jgi:hypothetical protein
MSSLEIDVGMQRTIKRPIGELTESIAKGFEMLVDKLDEITTKICKSLDKINTNLEAIWADMPT